MAPVTQTKTRLAQALTELKALSERKDCNCKCVECLAMAADAPDNKCHCKKCEESDRLSGE